MLGLIARFDLKNENAAVVFDQLVAETGEKIRANEPGTLAYTVHDVVDEPLARVFYELYQDRDAFDEHRGQPYVVRFLAECKEYATNIRIEYVTPRSVEEADIR